MVYAVCRPTNVIYYLMRRKLYVMYLKDRSLDLFFLIFIIMNKVVNVSNKLKYLLFADGTISLSCKITNNVENIVNIKLNKIHKWLTYCVRFWTVNIDNKVY